MGHIIEGRIEAQGKLGFCTSSDAPNGQVIYVKMTKMPFVHLVDD